MSLFWGGRGVHPPIHALTKQAPIITFADEEAFINVNTSAELSEVCARLKANPKDDT